MRAHRLFTHVPNRNDATAEYRAISPLADIVKNGSPHLPRGLEVSLQEEVSLPLAKLHDLAFFQRPANASELGGIRVFKSAGIPVVIDYDDLWSEIPSDNPTYAGYMNAQTQKVLRTIVETVDAVIVSTDELNRQLRKLVPSQTRIFTVNNALDDTHFVRGHRSQPPQETAPSLLWRGSPTHQRDLHTFAGPMVDAIRKHPKLGVTFAGFNPWYIREKLLPGQGSFEPGTSVLNYMNFVYRTAHRFGVVPLHDSLFNRCKSNIALLEMAWGGGVVVAPDWEEWRFPGVLNYSSADKFEAELEAAIGLSAEEARVMNLATWSYIKERYLLSKVNHLRAQVFAAVLGEADFPETQITKEAG